MAENLWMTAKEVTNIDRGTDPGHQKKKKILFSVKQVSKKKCSEKMFGTIDESFWK